MCASRLNCTVKHIMVHSTHTCARWLMSVWRFFNDYANISTHTYHWSCLTWRLRFALCSDAGWSCRRRRLGISVYDYLNIYIYKTNIPTPYICLMVDVCLVLLFGINPGIFRCLEYARPRAPRVVQHHKLCRQHSSRVTLQWQLRRFRETFAQPMRQQQLALSHFDWSYPGSY